MDNKNEEESKLKMLKLNSLLESIFKEGHVDELNINVKLKCPEVIALKLLIKTFAKTECKTENEIIIEVLKIGAMATIKNLVTHDELLRELAGDTKLNTKIEEELKNFKTNVLN